MTGECKLAKGFRLRTLIVQVDHSRRDWGKNHQSLLNTDITQDVEAPEADEEFEVER